MKALLTDLKWYDVDTSKFTENRLRVKDEDGTLKTVGTESIIDVVDDVRGECRVLYYNEHQMRSDSERLNKVEWDKVGTLRESESEAYEDWRLLKLDEPTKCVGCSLLRVENSYVERVTKVNSQEEVESCDYRVVEKMGCELDIKCKYSYSSKRSRPLKYSEGYKNPRGDKYVFVTDETYSLLKEFKTSIENISNYEVDTSWEVNSIMLGEHNLSYIVDKVSYGYLDKEYHDYLDITLCFKQGKDKRKLKLNELYKCTKRHKLYEYKEQATKLVEELEKQRMYVVDAARSRGWLED